MLVDIAFLIATWCYVTASFTPFDIYKTNTTDYGIPLTAVKTRDHYECLTKCSGDELCRSATFDNVDGCTTNGLPAESSMICGGTIGECGGLAALMYVQKRMETTMRLACLDDSDCMDPGSICVRNKCQCELGHHYDGTSYACVTSCMSYGMTFQPDYGKTIDKNNKDIHDNVTLDFCFDACIVDTECRSFEYNHVTLNCRLAVVTALDVGPDEYKDNNQNTLYTRDCGY